MYVKSGKLLRWQSEFALGGVNFFHRSLSFIVESTSCSVPISLLRFAEKMPILRGLVERMRIRHQMYLLLFEDARNRPGFDSRRTHALCMSVCSVTAIIIPFHKHFASRVSFLQAGSREKGAPRASCALCGPCLDRGGA